MVHILSIHKIATESAYFLEMFQKYIMKNFLNKKHPKIKISGKVVQKNRPKNN
jgi:hypothetical protein